MSNNKFHQFYVSPSGCDHTGSGTTGAPWKTLDYAVKQLHPGDTLYLRGGIYRETLKPTCSGTAEHPITLTSYPGETPVITTLEPVSGQWERIENFPSFTLEPEGKNPPVYTVACPMALGVENQVFENGDALCEARWPHNTGRSLLDPAFATIEGTDGHSVVDSHIPGTAEDIKNSYLWCIGGAAWVAWNNKIVDFDEEKREIIVPAEDKNPGYGHFYSPRVGNSYVLMGKKELLGAPGEWWYEEKEGLLYVWSRDGKAPSDHQMEYKSRMLTADFSGISYYHISGITFLGGGILTDSTSSYLHLDQLQVYYTYHCFLSGFDANSPYGSVNIEGHHITLENSELAYSSGSIVTIRGKYNRLFNCYIHHGGYGAVWKGAFSVAGTRNLVSHNTICYSGRDLVTIHGIREGVLEYNDLHHSGCITSDLGLTYGHNTDGNGTVIRYNYVHDNMADDCSFGIYFDHLSHNFIVHDNLIANLRNDPVRFNNPGYCDQVFNNRASNTQETKTFDHADRQDLFGMRYTDNVVNLPINYPQHAVVLRNQILPDYQLPAANHCGRKEEPQAYQGIELEHQHPVWDSHQYPYSSKIYNGCFECDELTGWSFCGNGAAELVEGNGWGHIPYSNTGTSFHELKLTGTSAVYQSITELLPNTDYMASGWVKCEGGKGCFGLLLDEALDMLPEAITRAVTVYPDHKSMGVELKVSGSIACSTEKKDWQRYIFHFHTSEHPSATLFFAKDGEEGAVFCDNAFLCLTGEAPNLV